jgi:hypothetical protein
MDIAAQAIQIRVARTKLPEQMAPLVLELAGCAWDRCDRTHRADFGAIEGVSASSGLEPYRSEIGIDRAARRGVLAEPLQLRMMPVAPGLAAQYRARQQPFPPKGDETLRVQIMRMYRPQAHVPDGASRRAVRRAAAPPGNGMPLTARTHPLKVGGLTAPMRRYPLQVRAAIRREGYRSSREWQAAGPVPALDR